MLTDARDIHAVQRGCSGRHLQAVAGPVALVVALGPGVGMPDRHLAPAVRVRLIGLLLIAKAHICEESSPCAYAYALSR